MKTILVIDDDETLLDLATNLLTHHNYAVLTARNGQEGVRVLKNQLPDLIVLDVLMPVMDGFQFYKTIKSQKEYAQIPVIILTSRSQMRDTFLAIGVDCFIVKPYESKDLLSRIEQLTKGQSVDNLQISDQKIKLLETKAALDDLKRVLVAGTPSPMIPILQKSAKEKNYLVVFADSGSDLVEKTILVAPVVILLNAQVENITAYEIIRRLKQRPNFKSKVLLFSYFRNIDSATYSASHFFYAKYLNDDFKDDPSPPYYLGAFSKKDVKETFAKSFERFLK